MFAAVTCGSPLPGLAFGDEPLTVEGTLSYDAADPYDIHSDHRARDSGSVRLEPGRDTSLTEEVRSRAASGCARVIRSAEKAPVAGVRTRAGQTARSATLASAYERDGRS